MRKEAQDFSNVFHAAVRAGQQPKLHRAAIVIDDAMPSPPSASYLCPGPVSRRELLRFGLGGIAGLTLPDLLRMQSASAAGASRPDTAIILVWCHGGASHLETYDPKPDAPAEYRGPFKAIETSVPGLRYSELMPRQAKLAHRTSLLRSVVHRGICHQQGLQTLLTGHEQLVLKNKADYPDVMCVVNKVRERTGDALPASIGIPPLPYGGAAYLGSAYEVFSVQGDPNAPKFEVPNLQVAAPYGGERLSRRVRLLGDLDTARRDLAQNAEIAARDRQYGAAVEMLTSGAAHRAFDLAAEPDQTRDRYGRTRWGQSMLLARRLVEAGVSAVTVSLFGVEKGIASNWDDHAVNWDCFKASQERSPVFDQGVSALIEDLFDRGLDRKVLLVITGEFGRTPKISYTNGKPGRDHWPHCNSILLAGGSLRAGQVVGETDARGEYVTERPISPNDLLATIYRHLKIDPAREFLDYSGRPIRILDRTEPIVELV